MKKNRAISCLVLCWIFLSQPALLMGQPVYDSEWEIDLALSAGSAGLVGLGFYLEGQITPLTEAEIRELSKSQVNSFDRFACDNWSPQAGKWSDLLRNLCIVAPAALFLSDDVRDEAGHVALMYAETVALTAGFSMVTKGLARRIRPFAYNEEAPLELKLRPDARQSFYSGHTTMAFSTGVLAARIYSDVHDESDWEPLLWGGTLGVASAVAVLRVLAGKHFPTDVLVGALTGAAIGYAIPELHQANNKSREAPAALRFAFQIQF